MKLVLTIALLVAGLTVNADAGVVYTFSGSIETGPLERYTFQFTSPTFITQELTTPASALDYCTASLSACTKVEFFPAGLHDVLAIPPHPEIVLYLTGEPYLSVAFYFPYGSFAAPGTYAPVYSFNSATLTVTTPEPNSSWLFGIGLTLFVAKAAVRGGRGRAGN